MHYVKVTVFEEDMENWGRYKVNQYLTDYVLMSANPIPMDEWISKVAAKSWSHSGGDGKNQPFSAHSEVSVREWEAIGQRQFEEMVAKASSPDASFFDDRFIAVNLDDGKAVEYFGADPVWSGAFREASNPYFR